MSFAHSLTSFVKDNNDKKVFVELFWVASKQQKIEPILSKLSGIGHNFPGILFSSDNGTKRMHFRRSRMQKIIWAFILPSVDQFKKNRNCFHNALFEP